MAHEVEDINWVVDIEVTDCKTDPTKVTIKFVTNKGEGPEFDLDKGLARGLHQRLEEYLIDEDKRLTAIGK